MPSARTPRDTPGFSARCSIEAYFWRRRSLKLLLSLRPTRPRILTARWRRRTSRYRPFLLILRFNSGEGEKRNGRGYRTPRESSRVRGSSTGPARLAYDLDYGGITGRCVVARSPGAHRRVEP